MMLVVDDAHHLDPASAALVHQLAIGGHMLVVAAVRSHQPAPDAVFSLWKDRLALRLELQVLSQEETAELLRLALVGEVDAATAYDLWITSGGNPLFLRELVVTAVDEGVLVEDTGVWTLAGQLPVPASIQDVSWRRMAEMTSHELDAAFTLAFADPLGLEMVRGLHPHADLEEMERTGLIRMEHDGRRRPIALAHPMYGEVLRAEAPGTTTVEVAGRLTEAVEGLGARRREDALRVATWRLVAGGEAEPALLATAAQQAYHAGDFDLAERLSRAALDGENQPAVAVLLGQLLDERGEHAEAETHLRSLDLASLDPSLRKRTALARADNLFFGLSRPAEAEEVLEHAEPLMADDARGELIANRAWFDLHAGQPRAALKRIADIQADDSRGLVAAGIVASWAMALLGDTDTALDAAEEAAVRAQPSSYPAVSRHESFPELARGHALLHAGGLFEAEEVAREGQTAAITSRPSFLQARWTMLLASVLLERGLVVSAIAAFRQGASLQRRLGQDGLLRANLSGQVLSAAQAGATPQAEAAMEELDQLPDTPERLFEADISSARAWLAAAQGERSKAVALLGVAVSVARGSELVTVEARVQHDLVRLGEARDAAARLKELANLTDSASCSARASHAAATVDGDADRIEAAALELEQTGMWLLAAEAFATAATAYARSGRRRANICRRRATDLLTRCEGARPPSLILEDQPAQLTPREREVVTMAASGLSSKKIAERLVISVRTVNNLIQNAYIKLGVHNRTEAAAALGLEEDTPS
jgi:DNA-binding CsgD family transcriptional regulator